MTGEFSSTEAPLLEALELCKKLNCVFAVYEAVRGILERALVTDHI